MALLLPTGGGNSNSIRKSSRRSLAILTLVLSVKIHSEENVQLVARSAIEALISNLQVRGRDRMTPAGFSIATRTQVC
ncbi:hypothetical protein QUB63_21810 [Microcoleus sp. ARI1-B5]|uniref:hypothetical protein n=1 Tax=unclassified Microcoleus TaxID=2642155 RepID=UPI002FD07C87